MSTLVLCYDGLFYEIYDLNNVVVLDMLHTL